jgi:hypothetical protein
VVRRGVENVETGMPVIRDTSPAFSTSSIAHNAFAKLRINSRAQLTQLMRGSD